MSEIRILRQLVTLGTTSAKQNPALSLPDQPIAKDHIRFFL
jgi:hypothetical protein